MHQKLYSSNFIPLDIAEVDFTAEINTGDESGKNNNVVNTSPIFDLNPKPEIEIPIADNAQFTNIDNAHNCQKVIALKLKNK